MSLLLENPSIQRITRVHHCEKTTVPKRTHQEYHQTRTLLLKMVKSEHSRRMIHHFLFRKLTR